MKTRTSSPSNRGFSLVEVVLALGVASFALVSILGLLNVAVDTDGAASRDTTFAAMSGHVLNDLRAVPFDALWTEDPKEARDAEPSTATPAVSRYYFTQEGTPVAAKDVAENFDVLYQCIVTKTLDPQTRSVDSGHYNQLKLDLEFSWPVIGVSNVQKAGIQRLYASIARY